MVTEHFTLGGHTAEAVLSVDTSSSSVLTGDVAGMFMSDQTLVGDVNLTGDLMMMDGAVLRARPGVNVEGNQHELMFMDGASADWQGTPKSCWVEWGDPVVGWQVGDRLAVAPLDVGDYDTHYTTWTGNWDDVQPSTAVLSDGRTVHTEVVNLTRDITISNVSRIMFHMGAGVQTVKHVAVADSGILDELSFYSLHFHLNYDTVYGSLVEGVVVEGSRNHAFVPHGSNGVVFRDVAAVDCVDVPYWWDKPEAGDQTNNSDDTVWEHALALGVFGDSGRLSAFQLGAGKGNTARDCRAIGGRGGNNASGFIWPEFTGGGDNDEGVWDFSECVAHNNTENGIFVWQNVSRPHLIRDTLLYRNGQHGIFHGAYHNTYTYDNLDILENGSAPVHNRVTGQNCDDPTLGGPFTMRNIRADGPLRIGTHQSSSPCLAQYFNLSVTGVEIAQDHDKGFGYHEFHDSGLLPDDFVFFVADNGTVRTHPDSEYRIFEDGVLVHLWADGSWG